MNQAIDKELKNTPGIQPDEHDNIRRILSQYKESFDIWFPTEMLILCQDLVQVKTRNLSSP